MKPLDSHTIQLQQFESLMNLIVVTQKQDLASTIEEILNNQCSTVKHVDSAKYAIYDLETSRDVDLIFYDISFYEMDRESLIKRMRAINPELPIVLMGSINHYPMIKDILINGAIHFLELPIKETQLYNILAEVDKFAQQKAIQVHDSSIDNLNFEFSIRSGHLNIDNVKKTLEELLRKYTKMNYLGILNVLCAFQETVQNALEHGNLELQSEWKEEYISDQECTVFEKKKKERLIDPPFANRQVNICMHIQPLYVEFSVTDEGSGIDTSVLDSEYDGAIHGLGLKMVHSLMDKVTLNPHENRVTLRKYYDY